MGLATPGIRTLEWAACFLPKPTCRLAKGPGVPASSATCRRGPNASRAAGLQQGQRALSEKKPAWQLCLPRMWQAGHTEAVETGLHPHIFLESNGVRATWSQDPTQSPCLEAGGTPVLPAHHWALKGLHQARRRIREVTVLKAHTDAWCQLCHHPLATWTRRRAARSREAHANVRPQVPRACSSLPASKPLSAAEASVSLGLLG